MEHGFGRNPSPFDSRNWPVERLRELIDTGAAVPVTWNDPVLLNQGSTPRCVGYSGAGFKATAQAKAPADATVTNADGDDIYARCKVRDGNDSAGTSIWQLAHVLKDMGIIDAYAFGSHADAKQWVQTRGPVPIGTNWYSGMMSADLAGVIHKTGTIRGGHATLWHGQDSIVLGAGTLRNSWGPWGFRKSGDAAIYDDELATLIDSENGDALFAVKYVAPKPLPWPDFPPEYAAEGWAVKESGLFAGYADGTFRPAEKLQPWQVSTVIQRLCDDRPVSRLDMLLMLAWFVTR